VGDYVKHPSGLGIMGWERETLGTIVERPIAGQHLRVRLDQSLVLLDPAEVMLGVGDRRGRGYRSRLRSEQTGVHARWRGPARTLVVQTVVVVVMVMVMVILPRVALE